MGVGCDSQRDSDVRATAAAGGRQQPAGPPCATMRQQVTLLVSRGAARRWLRAAKASSSSERSKMAPGGGREPAPPGDSLEAPLLPSTCPAEPASSDEPGSSGARGCVVLLDDGGGSGGAPALAKSSLGATPWLLTTAIMLADMFGLGTLSLPGDFARMGWLPAAACLVAFAAACVYAGVLYQRLSLAVPRAVVFDEIGRAAMPRVGAALVYGTVYLTILCEPAIFHIVCQETLAQAFYSFNLSKPAACLIVTALIIPLAQMHEMEDVAWVSILGTVGMLGAMLVVLGKLLLLWLQQEAPARTDMVVTGTTWDYALVGAMDIAFAFGGQINWMRYITTTRERHKFATAVSLTTGFMSVVYVFISVAGYSVLGSDTDVHQPISSLVGQDGWTVVMNAGIFLHCLIAYQINANVWCSLLLHMAVPKYADGLAEHKTLGKRGIWFATTLLCVAFGALVAYTLPFFSIVMAVIASLGDIMSMFGLPCLFAIYLVSMPRWETGLCWALVVLAVGLSGAGVVSSMQQLVAAARGSGG